MDSDREEAEVFSDAEDSDALRAEEEEEEVKEENEEEGEDDDEDARTFNAWMQQYRGGERQERPGEEEEAEEATEGGRAESRCSSEVPGQMRADRRASLPVRKSGH